MAKTVSRRTALSALGIGTVAVGTMAASACSADAATAVASTDVTVASWAQTRGATYTIGHRGSGDVYPEHSMEGYRAAVAAGAQCLEISVGMTSDGVLVCMHDLTYDRTTTTTGTLSTQPSTILRSVRFDIPQIGPAWAAQPQPLVPYLDDVLDEFGGSVVLCIEAKNDAAYPAMISAIQARGLQSSVIIKAYYTSSRIAQAKQAGFPVFGYLGSTADVTAANITTLAGKLTAATDYLVLPLGDNNTYLDDSLVKAAVATKIPVWVFALHRRVDLAHYAALGCVGFVCSSRGYISGTKAFATADTWAFGAIAPGEMTKDPSSPTFAPVWSGNEIHLGAKISQHFLTLGHFSPVTNAKASYTVNFQAAWLTLPADLTTNLTLAFGQADDTYYEHRAGTSNGYHAIARANGSVELYSHVVGNANGTELGAAMPSAAPKVGQWMTFQLKVTPTGITWARTDVAGATITVTDATYRGGYLHIGRSSIDGVLAFRTLNLS